MGFEHILFDLDGTLTDPGEGITGGILYARKKWGLDPGRKEDYYKFIGPPMPQSFEQYWGMSSSEAQAFLACYREYYTTIGLFENQLYPDMEPFLSDLKKAGCQLYVATSKPTFMSVQILEKFGLAPYFTCISGSDPQRKDCTKAEVIQSVLDRYAIPEGSGVMIGDRCFDVEGAHQCSLPCAAVTYGYGSRDELQNAGADFLADTLEDLRQILLS